MIHTNYALVGVPQQPVINGVVSTSPGVAHLNVSTREAGIEDGGLIQIIIKAEVINDGTVIMVSQEIINYVDTNAILVVITNLAHGVDYRFTARIQNEFGVSASSETREVQIQIISPNSSISIGMTLIVIPHIYTLIPISRIYFMLGEGHQ